MFISEFSILETLDTPVGVHADTHGCRECDILFLCFSLALPVYQAFSSSVFLLPLSPSFSLPFPSLSYSDLNMIQKRTNPQNQVFKLMVQVLRLSRYPLAVT